MSRRPWDSVLTYTGGDQLFMFIVNVCSGSECDPIPIVMMCGVDPARVPWTFITLL